MQLVWTIHYADWLCNNIITIYKSLFVVMCLLYTHNIWATKICTYKWTREQTPFLQQDDKLLTTSRAEWEFVTWECLPSLFPYPYTLLITRSASDQARSHWGHECITLLWPEVAFKTGDTNHPPPPPKLDSTHLLGVTIISVPGISTALGQQWGTLTIIISSGHLCL